MNAPTALTLAILLLCQLVTIQTAPLVARESTRNKRHSSVESKVSLLLGNGMDEPAEKASQFAEKLFRHKRSASASEAAIDADVTALLEEQGLQGPSNPRSRRSMALFWLSASLHLCNKYAHLCQRIEIDEAEARMRIRLEDA